MLIWVCTGESKALANHRAIYRNQELPTANNRGLSGFEFQGTTRVITLQQWIEQEGAEGRRRLFAAIKAEYPKFTQVGLTNYIRGHRIPEYQIAEIISKVTGIPIFLISFRYVNKPGEAER